MARPTTTTSRSAARAASATARMRADVGGEGRDRDAAARALDQLGEGFARRRLPTASGPRAPHWWNRRSAPGSPRRRARAASPRRSVGPGSASDRSSSRRCAARCRAGVRMISAFDSGIECAIDTSSTSNGPTVKRPPSGTIGHRNFRRARLARALGFEQRGRERRGIDRHLQLRPQIDQRAEMVLVRVGEHECRRGSCAPPRDSGCPAGSDRCPAGAPRRRTTTPRSTASQVRRRSSPSP